MGQSDPPKSRRYWFDIRLQSFIWAVQQIMYGAVALSILLATGFVIFDALSAFLNIFQVNGASISHTVLTVVDRLLLALMLLEILHTVEITFDEGFHLACVEPFLFVGIIASIRRILIISIEMSHQGSFEQAIFKAFMIETGVLGLLILSFIIGLVLLRRSRIKAIS